MGTVVVTGTLDDSAPQVGPRSLFFPPRLQAFRTKGNFQK
jgi:hypothetical protein